MRRGALVVAPNRDATYPEPTGLIPGTGAAVAALESAANTEAIVVGKPAPDLIISAMQRVGASPATTVMIGDSPVTDIAAARAAGVRSILMLTGVTNEEEAAALPTSLSATYVARDAEELSALLAEMS